MSAARKAVLQARAALVLDSPFFGALALRLRLEEDASCDTAWTDGQSIGYNPEFVESLSAAQLVGLIAHEVMHVAAGHPWRRDGRDAKRWNIAADYTINGTLTDAGMQLPAGALLDAQYTGKGAEWIFDRLPAEGDDGSGTGSGGAGEPEPSPAGEVRDAPTDDDAPTEAEWSQAVQQAANVAKARGSLPGALERFAAAAASPAVDWRAALARFVQLAAKNDYSWQRPNVRHLARGLYLPALRSEAMGRLAVAVDVSGSVDPVQLEQFAAEIRGIAEQCRPEAVDVLYCDSRVQKRETFEEGDRVELRACGGGGTDFRPVFEALAGEEPPACLVYLTDLYGRFPDAAPEFPVLWAATSTAPAPWGERVAVT